MNDESNRIEIYVRPSGDRVMLNFHVPEALKEALIAGIRDGSFSTDAARMNVELSLLPQWITDGDDRKAYEKQFSSVHVRIPIDTVNTNFE